MIYQHLIKKEAVNHMDIYNTREWFVLQFKPNSHHQAVRNLNQQGFETFLPLDGSALHQKPRLANVIKPLFPGYMFVAFDRKNTPWNIINSTYGVSRLITFNSIPKSIPKSFINDLKKRCDSTGIIRAKRQLKSGDQVKVSTGPFTNFIATVESIEADKRIAILMDLMGRRTKLTTKIDNLQLLT